MSTTVVQIDKLPRSVQMQLPMSIRSAKNIYVLEELPPKERNIIKEYIDSVIDVKYSKAFDVTPEISKFNDLSVLTTVKDLIGEYLTNYFYITPCSYPFDPTFGCALKQQLQTLLKR